MKITHIPFALAASTLLFFPAPAFAVCQEGATVMGECANPGLAAIMRLNARVFSQSQLSQTAPPVMPQQDFTYRYPHSLTTTPPQGHTTQAAPTFTLPPPGTPCMGEGCE